MQRQSCINNRNIFCYICGLFTPSKIQRNITSKLKTVYKHYFDCELGNQDKPWVPHIVCNSFYSSLTSWLDCSRVRGLPFTVHVIWHEPMDYITDCYFCMSSVAGFTIKTRTHIKYPDCRSALKPLPHDDKNPKPKPPE